VELLGSQIPSFNDSASLAVGPSELSSLSGENSLDMSDETLGRFPSRISLSFLLRGLLKKDMKELRRGADISDVGEVSDDFNELLGEWGGVIRECRRSLLKWTLGSVVPL
jgi:hypothetical protein